MRCASIKMRLTLYHGHEVFKKKERLFWWSDAQDSPKFPLQGAQVPSLVGELRSCVPQGMAKIIKIFKKY